MTMPNFLIIGAAKSGTSALYHYLRQHRQIFMSAKKEPHFFGFEGEDAHTNGPGDTIRNAITNLADYRALFADVSEEVAVGEASPTYLYLPRACERIRHYLPDAKLICILRNPAERAYSAYMHLVRDGRETCDTFKDALQLERQRIEDNWGPIWHYRNGGNYHAQLGPYFESFSRDQIKIYLYEDFNQSPKQVIGDIYRYLEVDDDWFPDFSVRPNVSGVPKSETFQRLLHRFFVEPNIIKTFARKTIPFELRWAFTTAIRRANLAKPPLSEEMRETLMSYYREDILNLQRLIGRDLSAWFR